MTNLGVNFAIQTHDRAFNVYLDQHIKMISDQAQLYRPLEENPEVLEEHLMREGSEGLQSAASKEIDGLLRMWKIEKVRLDEENSLKSSDNESSKRPRTDVGVYWKM